MGYSEIQKYLTYEERKLYLRDICKIYSYSDEKKKDILKTWSDDRLLTFREILREQGKLIGFVCSSIHIQAILGMFGGNKYEIDECGELTRVHVGVEYDTLDKFGHLERHELGYLDIDQDWRIKEFEMHGEKAKRFNGLQLIIMGNKISARLA